MCLSQFIRTNSNRLLGNYASNRIFNAKYSTIGASTSFHTPLVKFTFPSKVHFSTQKPADVKVLTDDILRAARSKQTSQNEDEQHSKESEETKKQDEFSKRAMKYTFLAFGAMFAGFTGLAIYEWGR